MTAKHTPGPWHRNTSPSYPIYAGERPNWVHVAMVIGPGEADNPERQANYRLVAEAPAMLEALRAVAASSMRNAAYDQCVAIINRIEGNQP